MTLTSKANATEGAGLVFDDPQPGSAVIRPCLEVCRPGQKHPRTFAVVAANDRRKIGRWEPLEWYSRAKAAVTVEIAARPSRHVHLDCVGATAVTAEVDLLAPRATAVYSLWAITVLD